MPPKTTARDAMTARLPLLPLRDMVVFPRMVVPLLVGRPMSLAAVEESLAADVPLFLCAQNDPAVAEPAAADMCRVGVASSILQTMRMPDGNMKVVVEALGRGTVKRFYFKDDLAEALVRKDDIVCEDSDELQATIRTVMDLFESYSRSTQRVAPEILQTIREISEPDVLSDTLCAYLPLRLDERQELLQCDTTKQRLERAAAMLMRENQMLEIEKSVRERVRDQMERGQREHYLQEQLKAIYQELGNREEGMDEFSEMRLLIADAKLPTPIRERADREFARYERMPPMSPESTVLRSYLEWLVELPWNERTKDNIRFDKAREVLDRDHFGLNKVKDRILEFLAVRKLSKESKGPILCLVGPPGVGKTSLGRSIAEAMSRKFVRVSLGGVRDEAEIRGHRRTYIGALPGRIIQSMKKVGVVNPVFMLDEIDKMSVDFRGDPSSALLEVLDPAQNKDFSDHYLEVEFDLSEVFFIATANNEFDIPYALHDRLEVVRLPGYTLQEKEAIATGFLIPRQRETNGLKPTHFEISDQGLDVLVQRYTREAGVRELERQIANICRKVAVQVVGKKLKKKLVIDGVKVLEMLGPPPYSALRSEAVPRVGVAIGLAWTQVGGDVLTIETAVLQGKGRLALTGQLGDVMKESGQTAFAYLKANAGDYGIDLEKLKETDLHIHVPEGAIPKDGPSAGTALTVSMLSAITGKAPREALAMTGETTLRGRVLPVGGIKEKVIAAHRAGIRNILLPKDNEKDFPDIPDEVRNDIAFTLVEDIGQVIEAAFDGPITTKGE